MNLKENKKGYMGQFGARKGECCNYAIIPRIKNNNKTTF